MRTALFLCFFLINDVHGRQRRIEPQASSPPGFIIGVWQQPASLFPTWKARGINTVFTEKPKPDYNPDRAAYFAAASAAGLRIVIGPDPAGPRRDLAHPAFLAWMMPDEPENWNHLKTRRNGRLDFPASIAGYTELSERLKRISPNTPVHGNFNGMQITATRDFRDALGGIMISDYEAFFDATDWISGDWYVRGTGREAQRIPELVGGMVDRIRDWSGGQKPVFAFVESSNIRHPSFSGSAAPTPEELRAHIWTAIIHGATGIIYFPLQFGGSFDFDATPARLAKAMANVNEEIQMHQRFLLGGERIRHSGESATWTLRNGSSLSASVVWNVRKKGWQTQVLIQPRQP